MRTYSETPLSTIDRIIRENPDRKILLVMSDALLGIGAHGESQDMAKMMQHQKRAQYQALFSNKGLAESDKVFKLLRPPAQIAGLRTEITDPAKQITVAEGLTEVKMTAAGEYFSRKYSNVSAITKQLAASDALMGSARAKFTKTPVLPDDAIHPADIGKIYIEAGGIPYNDVYLYYYATYSKYDLIINLTDNLMGNSLSNVITPIILGKAPWIEKDERFSPFIEVFASKNTKLAREESDAAIFSDSKLARPWIPKMNYVKTPSKPTTYINITYDAPPRLNDAAATIPSTMAMDSNADGLLTPEEIIEFNGLITASNTTKAVEENHVIVNNAHRHNIFQQLLNAQATVEYMLSWFDQNDDGVISTEEYQISMQRFEPWRKWRTPSGNRFIPHDAHIELYHIYDTDNDLRITLEEIKAVDEKAMISKFKAREDDVNREKYFGVIPSILANPLDKEDFDTLMLAAEAYLVANGKRDAGGELGLVAPDEVLEHMAAGKYGAAWDEALVHVGNNVNIYGDKEQYISLKPLIDGFLEAILPLNPEFEGWTYCQGLPIATTQVVINDSEITPVLDTIQGMTNPPMGPKQRNHVKYIIKLESIQAWINTLEELDSNETHFDLVFVKKVGQDYLVINPKKRRVFFKDRSVRIKSVMQSNGLIISLLEAIPGLENEIRFHDTKSGYRAEGYKTYFIRKAQGKLWKTTNLTFQENKEYTEYLDRQNQSRFSALLGKGYKETAVLEIADKVWAGVYVTPQWEMEYRQKHRIITQNIKKHSASTGTPLAVSFKNAERQPCVIKIRVFSKSGGNSFPSEQEVSDLQNKVHSEMESRVGFQNFISTNFTYHYIYDSDQKKLHYITRTMRHVNSASYRLPFISGSR